MNQLELVDGRAEILPGLWVEPAPGPTSGHQIVRGGLVGPSTVFLGSLVPTTMHLSPRVISADDRSPEETASSKHKILQRALEEDWLLAPVGCDRWVEASELLELASEIKQPVLQQEALPQPSLVLTGAAL